MASADIVDMFEITGSGLTRGLYLIDLRDDQSLDFEDSPTLPIRVQLRENPRVGDSVSISVTDVDETRPAAGPLFSVTELREITGTAAADILEDRARNAPNTNELIQGGNGGDRIATFGGDDVVIGGAGEDFIFLGTDAPTGAETVVYRFESDGSPNNGNWRATDGHDTINDFELGKDKLVLVDVSDGAAPITSLADLIAATNDRLSVTVELRGGFIDIIRIRFDLDADGGTADADARTIQITFTSTTRLAFDATVSERFTQIGQPVNQTYELNDNHYGYIDDLFGGEDFFKVGDESKLPDRFTILEGPDPAAPGSLFELSNAMVANPVLGTTGNDNGRSGQPPAIMGTTNADLIQGRAGDDTISTNGGDDVVIGGQGFDTINLGTGAETVVYRFESDGAARFDGNWQATDNSEMINNFEYGVDKLVFVDVNDDHNGIPIANLGAFDIDEDRPQILALAGGPDVVAVVINFMIDETQVRTLTIIFSTGSGPTLASISDHVDRASPTGPTRNNYILKGESSIANLFDPNLLDDEDFFKVGDASQLPNNLDIM